MKRFKNFETELINQTYFNFPNYNKEFVFASDLKDIVLSFDEVSQEFLDKVDFEEISNYINQMTSEII